jgi:hypothetical protein
VARVLRVAADPGGDLLVARHLENVPAACLNPGCPNQCAYPVTKSGKRPLFCSPACTKRYSAHRRRFLEDLAIADRALAETPSTGREAARLRMHRARVIWHLARHGGEGDDSPKK